MIEDVLKGSLIACYMSSRMKNYMALAKDRYQLVCYIPLPFMKRLTEY
jgi:hypothetical protein